MNATYELSLITDTKSACYSFSVPRSSFYRSMKPQENKPKKGPQNALALSQIEKQNVLDMLHSERFIDKTPYEVYATLLDENKYFCSISTMYRILNEEGEVCERRRGHRQHNYVKPELLATAPNQVWSWDITKLKSDTKWNYYYLYVIMDIFSRYVTGWMVEERETAVLAKDFLQQTIDKYEINPDQLTVHADRGSSMKSKTVAQMLSDLNVMKSHNRPYVSNDNPYSESNFKTLKYNPEFPEKFGSIQDARSFCRTFFDWYNNEHHHTGIALLTAKMVHFKLDKKIIQQRNITLQNAFNKKPARFKNKMPQHKNIPKSVWINKPDNTDQYCKHIVNDNMNNKTELDN
ncbi:MAG: IS3 family transposase [Proteobacteria bacterium]|nr:IS3 family transposase [Pseudomonadota bacterium]